MKDNVIVERHLEALAIVTKKQIDAFQSGSSSNEEFNSALTSIFQATGTSAPEFDSAITSIFQATSTSALEFDSELNNIFGTED